MEGWWSGRGLVGGGGVGWGGTDDGAAEFSVLDDAGGDSPNSRLAHGHQRPRATRALDVPR